MILIIRYLYFSTGLIFLVFSSCKSSKQLAEKSEENNRLKLMVAACKIKDSLYSTELNTNRFLRDQLDKTETVLAKIYLQYSTQIPRHLENIENYKLNSVVAEENLNLQIQLAQKVKEIDSLNLIKSYVPPVENVSNKKSKNNFDQQFYIHQLEKNLKTENLKNQQLLKDLNSYSLRLEIIDNERLKEVKSIQSQLEKARFTKDSLVLELANNEKKLDSLKSTVLTSNNSNRNSDNQYKEKINKYEKELTLLDSIANLKNLDLIRIQDSLVQISNFNTTLLQEVNTLKNESSDLRSSNDLLKNENHQLSESKKLILEENIQLAKEINSKKSNPFVNPIDSVELANLSGKIQELESENKHQKHTIQIQNEQILELSKKASKINTTKSKDEKILQDSIDKKQNEIVQLNHEIKSISNKLTNENNLLKDKLRKTDSSLIETHKVKAQMSNEIQSLKNQLASVAIQSNHQQNKHESPSNSTSLNTSTNKSDPKIANPKTEYSKLSVVDSIKALSIEDETILRLQKIFKENNWNDILIRKEEGNAILLIPQSLIYFNDTYALNEIGSKLILKIFNTLNGIKKYEIDIIGFSEPERFSDEFRKNRATTIQKLFKVFGAPLINLNTDSRNYNQIEYQPAFKDGIELIVKRLR
ncbi:MAG: hypothetical protein IT267_02125 [Saprospiraceae bacterium]|nr:hypothetical protein [Saprospiraceae bacterium]